jgi:Predicted DNA modification methylase
MSTGIGAAMAGGKRGSGSPRKRQHADWYPTPSDVTQVLLERVKFDGPVSEPCCGDGSLAMVMENHGYHVIGTDLYDRGYGVGHGKAFDILAMRELPAPNIVTNPPFNIAGQIIEHLMAMRPKKMALLLKASFWHAKTRRRLFDAYPPSKIIALTWRPDFLHLKRPTMEVMWCVWEEGSNVTEYMLAHRPPREKKPREPLRVIPNEELAAA